MFIGSGPNFEEIHAPSLVYIFAILNLIYYTEYFYIFLTSCVRFHKLFNDVDNVPLALNDICIDDYSWKFGRDGEECIQKD